MNQELSSASMLQFSPEIEMEICADWFITKMLGDMDKINMFGMKFRIHVMLQKKQNELKKKVDGLM